MVVDRIGLIRDMMEEAAAEESMETMVVQVCNLLKLAKTAHTDMDMMVDSALGKILRYAMVKARGILVVVEAEVDLVRMVLRQHVRVDTVVMVG